VPDFRLDFLDPRDFDFVVKVTRLPLAINETLGKATTPTLFTIQIE